MDRNKAKSSIVPEWLLYVAYPALTALVTFGLNQWSKALFFQSDYVAADYLPFLSLAGAFLIPAFIAQAAIRWQKAQQDKRLFALGPTGITCIGAVQLIVFIAFSDAAKIGLLHLLLGGI